nr:unnamed protein product [Callosobruchus analis]
MTIQFMMARSQKPIIVRAVPFGVYNYALFLATIKTAYSYITLLNNYSD